MQRLIFKMLQLSLIIFKPTRFCSAYSRSYRGKKYMTITQLYLMFIKISQNKNFLYPWKFVLTKLENFSKIFFLKQFN